MNRLKTCNDHLLWDVVPSQVPGYGSIPAMAKQVEETEKRIGKYTIGSVLGEGNYACVYDGSSTSESNETLAIKVIDKDNVSNLLSLGRINDEIRALKDPEMQHEGVIRLVDIVHTQRFLYLITEKGGKDFFEHFDAYTGK